MCETELTPELTPELALELITSHTLEVIWGIIVSKTLPQPITTIFDRYILIQIYLQTMGITIT